MDSNSQPLGEGLIISLGENAMMGSSTPQDDPDLYAGTTNGRANGEMEYLSVDDMLVKHVGEFGWAQFWHFVFVSLAWTVEAMHTFVMIFGDHVPEWHCLPHGGLLQAAGTNDSILSVPMCTASSVLCELEPRTWEWVGGKSQSTVSEWGLICGEDYKVGLAGSLFFIGFLSGSGIYGSLSDSFLGRKGTLALACMTTVTLGLLTSIAPSYWIYASLRFVTGFNCGGIGLCSFVLATEIVGPNKRGSVGMSAFYFFSSGVMLLPFFAYFWSSWRSLYVATAVPGIAYCCLVLPFMWESPRWYLIKGRLGDAMNALRTFAKRNGNVVPEGVHLRLDCCASEEERGGGVGQDGKKMMLPVAPSGKHVEETASLISGPKDCQAHCAVRLEEDADTSKQPQEHPVGTLLDVLRYGETRWRMLLMVLIWFFTGVVYYGISLNVVNLGFNLYVSVFVNGLIEFPAFAGTAFLLGRMGRRALLAAAMALSGFCCLVGSFVFIVGTSDGFEGGNGFLLGGPAKRINSTRTYLKQIDAAHHDSGLRTSATFMGVMRLFCGVLGIFGMAGTYNLIYIYTAELFPTVVRNAALGLAAQAAGIGSVIAPFIVVVGHSSPFLPFLVFGVLALTGAALSTRLPETLGQPLLDTMEGMKRNENTKVDVAKKVTLQEKGSLTTLQSS